MEDVERDEKDCTVTAPSLHHHRTIIVQVRTYLHDEVEDVERDEKDQYDQHGIEVHLGWCGDVAVMVQ